MCHPLPFTLSVCSCHSVSPDTPMADRLACLEIKSMSFIDSSRVSVLQCQVCRWCLWRTQTKRSWGRCRRWPGKAPHPSGNSQGLFQKRERRNILTKNERQVSLSWDEAYFVILRSFVYLHYSLGIVTVNSQLQCTQQYNGHCLPADRSKDKVYFYKYNAHS